MPATTSTMAKPSLTLSAIDVVLSVVMLSVSGLSAYFGWQGQRASNPQPSVLETDALPIELCPCGGSSPKYLLDDLRDDAGAHRLAALADGKAKPLLHGDGRDQRHHHLHVVPGHHHFGALGQLHRPGHVGRAEVKLRPVVVEKRRVAPALFLAQYVDFAFELGVRRNAA